MECAGSAGEGVRFCFPHVVRQIRLRTQCSTSKEPMSRASLIPESAGRAECCVGQIQDDWTSGASEICTVIRLLSVRRNSTLRQLPSGIAGGTGIDRAEHFGDDATLLGGQVHMGHKMYFHASRTVAQNPVKAGQLSEPHMVVAVVVIEFLERGECLVKQVARTDFDGVYEGFVSCIHPHHLLVDELFLARYLLIECCFFRFDSVELELKCVELLPACLGVALTAPTGLAQGFEPF